MGASLAIGPADLVADLPAIEHLIAAVEAIDGHRPIGERKARGLTESTQELIGLVGRSEGRVAAFVALTPASDTYWAMELAVEPEFRERDNYRQLFGAAAEKASSRGARGLRAWLFQPGLARAAVAEGFREERQLFKMERQLPVAERAEYPEGIEVRPFRLGDEPAWLAVNNRAFVGHPENGGWTIPELTTRLEQDWFEPWMLLMAWDGSHLAGFNWLKRDESGGEIYVIAVDPDYQGRGLGRALIVDGLRRLEKSGAERGFLYVDADNQRALRLYRRLGFYLDHVDRAFVREL
jgi:mycothiol synthase